ncbi:MAG: OFA family MFS transporter [bacterium]|jgi:OFA family oxalate/formate antiporter-like MFS transporter
MSLNNKRWWIAVSGTCLQICLGSVYAWSYFQMPLMNRYHWSNTQVSWVFSLAICFLGLAAAWGGMNLGKWGPRRLAMLGGVLFGSGTLIAALALHVESLILLYVGYGIVGGTGLGLGYVTPVATVAKWFPDKKGFVTGMVVMGFGLGAMLMSKVLAPMLMAATGGNPVSVFAFLGVFFLITVTLCGTVLQNPPAGYVPEGMTPTSSTVCAFSDEYVPISSYLLSRRFLTMWGVFFCNIVAGIAIIGFQSPLLQDLLRKENPVMTTSALVSTGATLIAVSSLFNGIGRFLWGGLSDRIGRIQVFRIMLATQGLAFLILSRVENPWLFAVLVCYVLLCYGGGFGAMPSFVLDVFGGKRMPWVYGSILTAWSAAGIVGPQIVAWLKDHYAQQAGPVSFLVGAGFLIIGLALSGYVTDEPFALRAPVNPKGSVLNDVVGKC